MTIFSFYGIIRNHTKEGEYMKKLIYNENTKEIDAIEQEKTDCFEEIEKENKDYKEKGENITKTVLELKEETIAKIDSEQKGEKKDFKNCLEIVKIFCEIFSSIVLGIMGIVLTFSGNNINMQTKEIYERQLAIIENDKKPHFSIKYNYSSTDNKSGVDGKIPIRYYCITNEGGNIKYVRVRPESYIYFYVPADVEKEYYIFKFQSHDFYIDYGQWIETVKEDKEYRFSEYIIKEENKSEWECIAKMVLNYFPDIKCVHENIVNISYTDYMGEEKEEDFTFDYNVIKKKYNEEWCIPIESNYGYDIDSETPKLATEEAKESAEEIKKQIDNWLKNNKGSRGHEKPEETRFEYIE